MLKDAGQLWESDDSYQATQLDGNGSRPARQTLTVDGADQLGAVDAVLGAGAPQRVGRFRFFLDGHRWEWSDAVARMHGYEPGVEPNTDLLLRHQHPEDREQVAAVLQRVLRGEPFSSRHRIIDAAGRTHCLVVAGDSMVDEAGTVIGTSGFYVDVTEAIQSDISKVLSQAAAARANIEQAKGALMTAYGISAERAFDILVWRSQETNVKLRDLADRFLAAIQGTTPPERLTYIDHALLTIE
ncbi:MAG TPA: PAS and ANTAR domain-containing protein [Mycobacterium sp.]